MKSISKKVLIIVLVVIAFTLFLWVGSAAYSGWNSSQWQKKTDAFQNVLEEPYKKDVYGGETPEETWAMYVDALERKDFDLAAKYYAVSHQERAAEEIKSVVDGGWTDKWIKELKTLEKDSQQTDKDRPKYWYRYYDKEFKKDLWGQVIFYQNPYTKVWKILY